MMEGMLCMINRRDVLVMEGMLCMINRGEMC